MKMNYNFLEGEGGAKPKTFHGGEYGYFLELHNASCVDLQITVKD